MQVSPNNKMWELCSKQTKYSQNSFLEFIFQGLNVEIHLSFLLATKSLSKMSYYHIFSIFQLVVKLYPSFMYIVQQSVSVDFNHFQSMKLTPKLIIPTI
jgi:hypothetical protein